MGGKIMTPVLGSTRVPLDILKMDNIHRKCARHLRCHYTLSVLTFWPVSFRDRKFRELASSMCNFGATLKMEVSVLE